MNEPRTQPSPGQLSFSKNKITVNWIVDWQTPDKYIAAARDVMGEIDLDPISSNRANERVKAKKHFTYKTNGLEQHWGGRVWLNPAYGILYECVDKLLKHYRSRDIEQAIFFTHTLTIWESWFQDLFRYSDAICFINELVEWYAGHTPELPQIHEMGIDPVYDQRGTIAAYFGPYTDKFTEVFSKFGAIIR